MHEMEWIKFLNAYDPKVKVCLSAVVGPNACEFSGLNYSEMGAPDKEQALRTQVATQKYRFNTCGIPHDRDEVRDRYKAPYTDPELERYSLINPDQDMLRSDSSPMSNIPITGDQRWCIQVAEAIFADPFKELTAEDMRDVRHAFNGRWQTDQQSWDQHRRLRKLFRPLTRRARHDLAMLKDALSPGVRLSWR